MVIYGTPIMQTYRFKYIFYTYLSLSMFSHGSVFFFFFYFYSHKSKMIPRAIGRITSCMILRKFHPSSSFFDNTMRSIFSGGSKAILLNLLLQTCFFCVVVHCMNFSFNEKTRKKNCHSSGMRAWSSRHI